MMNKKILIIAYLLLISCGSRKVNKEVSNEYKKEVIETTSLEKQKDSSYIVINEKLRLAIEKSTFNLEPIDNTKPFFIGSQKYENVKVVSSNEKETREEDKKTEETIIKIKNAFLQYQQKTESYVYEMNRQMERATYWGIGLAVFFVIIIMIILWYFRKKLKQATKVVEVAKQLGI